MMTRRRWVLAGGGVALAAAAGVAWLSARDPAAPACPGCGPGGHVVPAVLGPEGILGWRCGGCDREWVEYVEAGRWWDRLLPPW